MNAQESVKWKQIHATLFAMHSAEDQGLLSLLAKAFADVPAETVTAASQRYAEDTSEKVSRFRADQLSSLSRYIREIQAKQRRDAMPTSLNPLDRGECVLCQNTGSISVPHPACIELVEASDDGELRWRWKTSFPYTNLAFCSCTLGGIKFNAIQRSLEEKNSSKRALHITDYERDYASREAWQWLMQELARMRSAKDAANHYPIAAKAVDDTFGPVVLRLTRGA